VGSFHCAGMCGPLALALPVPTAGRAGYVMGRLFYNCGRVMTYAALGLVFGLLGRTLVLAGLQEGVSIGLGLALLAGLVVSRRFALTPPITRLVGGLKRVMGSFIRTRTLTALLTLGLLNGLLPCGLVYVACAGAAATGDLAAGAAYMAVFGLGTVPMMLTISLSGRLVQGALRRALLRAGPVSVALLAGLLILRGMGLGIPYLSPNLSRGGDGACCEPAGSAEGAGHRGP